MTAREVLDRYYFEVRCKLLEIAATLDRIDRAGGEPSDNRRKTIDRALNTLLEDTDDRAERIQMIFSRDYDPRWIDGFAPLQTKAN
jgi:hypothetical protein